ncbi:hypothetical protein FSP39_013052 [Pinctada imbricata]|uniref:J domain-containing protein n=1 Tax=Pinctada imbricata TaxID=66713 RepID=A0AA88YP37_PINIB|nr:hypothetical protein FSP39_013052 [Pinctada imbricata]
MIWDIVDWYRSAILLTRDLDMEAEAIAYARLGKLYDQVLKLKVQAKQYYTQALSLAESMHPRTFNDCAAVKKYQEETVQHEQEKEEKDKEKYKEELKEEFEELKVRERRFPPKNPEHTLPKEIDSTDKQAFKKLLQTSVVHYHPDRSDPEKNGMKWKVLSEQITKYLTNRYEAIKLLE